MFNFLVCLLVLTELCLCLHATPLTIISGAPRNAWAGLFALFGSIVRNDEQHSRRASRLVAVVDANDETDFHRLASCLLPFNSSSIYSIAINDELKREYIDRYAAVAESKLASVALDDAFSLLAYDLPRLWRRGGARRCVAPLASSCTETIPTTHLIYFEHDGVVQRGDLSAFIRVDVDDGDAFNRLPTAVTDAVAALPRASPHDVSARLCSMPSTNDDSISSSSSSTSLFNCSHVHIRRLLSTLPVANAFALDVHLSWTFSFAIHLNRWHLMNVSSELQAWVRLWRRHETMWKAKVMRQATFMLTLLGGPSPPRVSYVASGWYRGGLGRLELTMKEIDSANYLHWHGPRKPWLLEGNYGRWWRRSTLSSLVSCRELLTTRLGSEQCCNDEVNSINDNNNNNNNNDVINRARLKHYIDDNDLDDDDDEDAARPQWLVPRRDAPPSCSELAVGSRRRSGSPRIWLMTLTTVNHAFDSIFLASFIQHYLRLGVEPQHFIIVLNYDLRNLDTDTSAARAVAAEHGIRLIIWVDTFTPAAKMYIILQLLGERVAYNDWLIMADADEFQQYPRALPEFFASLDDHGFNAVHGVFVDRLSSNGTLANVRPTPPSLWHQFPRRCSVSDGVSNVSCLCKAIAMRGFLRTGGLGGNHFVAADNGCPPGARERSWLCCWESQHFIELRYRNWLPYNYACYPQARYYPHRLPVHHFKWIDGIIDGMLRRAHDFQRKGQNQFDVSKDFLRIVDHWQRNDERICVECDEALCVRSGRDDVGLPASLRSSSSSSSTNDDDVDDDDNNNNDTSLLYVTIVIDQCSLGASELSSLLVAAALRRSKRSRWHVSVALAADDAEATVATKTHDDHCIARSLSLSHGIEFIEFRRSEKFAFLRLLAMADVVVVSGARLHRLVEYAIGTYLIDKLVWHIRDTWRLPMKQVICHNPIECRFSAPPEQMMRAPFDGPARVLFASHHARFYYSQYDLGHFRTWYDPVVVAHQQQQKEEEEVVENDVDDSTAAPERRLVTLSIGGIEHVDGSPRLLPYLRLIRLILQSIDNSSLNVDVYILTRLHVGEFNGWEQRIMAALDRRLRRIDSNGTQEPLIHFFLAHNVSSYASFMKRRKVDVHFCVNDKSSSYALDCLEAMAAGVALVYVPSQRLHVHHRSLIRNEDEYDEEDDFKGVEGEQREEEEDDDDADQDDELLWTLRKPPIDLDHFSNMTNALLLSSSSDSVVDQALIRMLIENVSGERQRLGAAAIATLQRRGSAPTQMQALERTLLDVIYESKNFEQAYYNDVHGSDEEFFNAVGSGRVRNDVGATAATAAADVCIIIRHDYSISSCDLLNKTISSLFKESHSRWHALLLDAGAPATMTFTADCFSRLLFAFNQNRLRPLRWPIHMVNERRTAADMEPARQRWLRLSTRSLARCHPLSLAVLLIHLDAQDADANANANANNAHNSSYVQVSERMNHELLSSLLKSDGGDVNRSSSSSSSLLVETASNHVFRLRRSLSMTWAERSTFKFSHRDFALQSIRLTNV